MISKKIESKLLGIVLTSLFFLFVVVGFYMDGGKYKASDFSSDQLNIIPIVQKQLDQDAFSKDYVYDTLSKVDYYTPFFVTPLRWFSQIFAGNVFRGYNFFFLIINTIYTLGWFLFFFHFFGKRIDFAFLGTLLMRGILWPPGNEIWGFAGLWSFLPRTVFLAFLPYCLHAIASTSTNLSSNRKAIVWLLVGLIGNFHPISAVGFGVCFWLSGFLVSLFGSDKKANGFWKIIQENIIYFLCFIVGLLPFIYTFLSIQSGHKGFDQEEFRQLIAVRIDEGFLQIGPMYKGFFRSTWILLWWLPFLAAMIFWRKLTEQYGAAFKKWLVFFVCIVLFPLAFFVFEKIVGVLGIHINFSFQFTRNIKFLSLPGFIFILMLMRLFLESLPKLVYVRTVYPVSFVLLIASLAVRSFDSPLKNDMIRSLLPDSFLKYPFLQKKEDHGMEAIYDYVNQQKLQQWLFAAPTSFRAACKGSIVHDFKGGGMLIEGDPVSFIKWAKRELELKQQHGFTSKTAFYRKYGAALLIDLYSNDMKDSMIIHRVGDWVLYKL
jgi:hypothetical protein